MLITLYLLQLEKDAFVMQTVFIVVAWSLMHCCQQQNELALWILNWETNTEPERGTMTLAGLKYTTQLWEGAFVASASYHLFLRLVLVGNLSGMVENCRTNNNDHLCSHGSLCSFWNTNISWIISHAWPQPFFPINNLSFISLHACFEFLQFLAYCRSIAALWKVHEYKTLRNQSLTVSVKRCHSHVQKQSDKANATCHSECFCAAFDTPVSQE